MYNQNYLAAHEVLDRYSATGKEVFGIGKISDIFAAKGITHYVKAFSNEEVFDAMMNLGDVSAASSRPFGRASFTLGTPTASAASTSRQASPMAND